MLNSSIWISKISASSYWDLVYPIVTVHSSASATITVAGKTFTSDVSGNTPHTMPWGTFSISDSVSGQSFERTIGRDTTEVFIMPEGALYWYGNECVELSGGWYDFPQGNNINGGTLTKNMNDMKIYGSENSFSRIVGATNVIDATNYTNLFAITESTNLSSSVCMRTSPKWFVGDVKLCQVYNSKNNTKEVLTGKLNKSSATSGVVGSNAYSGCTNTVYAIWLE